jgi:hypothetical protein
MNPKQAMMMRSLAAQQEDPEGEGPTGHPLGGVPSPIGAPIGAGRNPQALEKLMQLIAPHPQPQQNQLSTLLDQILKGSGPADPGIGPGQV